MIFCVGYDNNYMSLILTRLLYPEDEVVCSFITELLLQQNIDACYYWGCEIYYSDIDNIFLLIWKVYFDFYAEYNPKMEKYIATRYRHWKEDRNLQYIFDIIHNLFHFTSSSKVFLLRQHACIQRKPLTIYRRSKHKKWEWLNKFDRKFYTFLKALYKKNLRCVATELCNLTRTHDAKEIYDTIIAYCAGSVPLLPSATIEKKWSNRAWTDDFHGLLALVVHLGTDMERILVKPVYKKPMADDVERYKLFHAQLEERHRTTCRAYRILRDFRHYSLHPGAGAFRTARNSVSDFKAKNILHWEYYAYNSPVWKERFRKYNGRQCDKDNTVYFDDDDNLELFYSRYGLEFDEQSHRTQSASLLHIKPLSWHRWHQNIFSEEPIIVFGNEHVYAYW